MTVAEPGGASFLCNNACETNTQKNISSIKNGEKNSQLSSQYNTLRHLHPYRACNIGVDVGSLLDVKKIK